MKKLAHGFNTAAQDSNAGSRSRKSKALPLSHCTTVPYAILCDSQLDHRFEVLALQSLNYTGSDDMTRSLKSEEIHVVQ